MVCLILSKCRKNTDIDSKSDDDIYYDGIGELAPSMDELNALLSEKPPHVKEKVLGMMLTGGFFISKSSQIL